MVSPNFDLLLTLDEARVYAESHNQKDTDFFEKIKQLANNKKKTVYRENAVVLFSQYVSDMTPHKEPYVIENWQIVLTLAGDYQASVNERARDLSRIIFDYFAKYSCKGYMTIGGLIGAIHTGSKLGTKKLGFEYFDEFFIKSI